MSTHNNLSSTLPFIPSSTSILTAHQLSKQHQDPYPAGGPGMGTLPAGSTWGHIAPPGAQPWQQPSESLHRKQLIPNTMRTLNSVQKDQNSKPNVISHQSVQQQQQQLNSRSGGGSGDPRSSGGGPVTSSAGSVPLVSVPIRHWWMVSFKLNYIFVICKISNLQCQLQSIWHKLLVLR